MSCLVPVLPNPPAPRSAATYPCCILLYLLLSVQGFHPGDPSVWAKGDGLLFSRGRMKFLLNFLPFLAIPQEVVATTIVALHFPPSSPLGLFST